MKSLDDVVITDESKKLQFDEDGSIKGNKSHISDVSRYLMPSLYEKLKHFEELSLQRNEPTCELSISCQLSSNFTLQVLSIVLSSKNEERTKLIKKLEKFGVIF